MQLPKALPDESLYSRICRYLSVCEYTTEQALELLVSNNRAAIHPYLTSNLHVIARFTDESPEALLSHQTLRLLFSHYLPQYRITIEDTAACPNDIIRASQLSTFRVKERLIVKQCPLCAREDMYEFGFAYWHLTHQVPGVEVCSKHRVWLVRRELPSRNHVNSHMLPDIKLLANDCNELAQDFSVFLASKMKTFLTEKPSVDALNASYFRQLNTYGFLTQRGRVRRKKLTKELFELSEKLFPLQSELSLRSLHDFNFISSLLSAQHPQHPFKHLLLDFYLSRCQSEYQFKGWQMNAQPHCVNKEKECCDLLKAGLSMAAVSRKIDKSRCYVKSIALRHDIPVNLEPKVITYHLKKFIIKLAKKGFHRAAIARCCGISTGSVELIISTTEGLVEWRKKCKFESVRRRYQRKILRYLGANPNAIRQMIKNVNKAEFYWLYKYERDWLELVLPIAVQTLQVDKVNWEHRDTEVFMTVNKAFFSSDIKLSRAALDRIVGGHGWLTSNLDKLPKTRAFLIKVGLYKQK